MNCENPIFIVGAPRSGTTLLRSMIDAHPNLCCPTWETGLFERFTAIMDGDIQWHFKNDSALAVDRSALLDWMRRSCDDLMKQLTAPTGKPRWAEKTPAHVFHIDLIHEMYPQVQFIHILRNGRDVVRSLQSMQWAPRDIRWSCRRWVDSVQAARRAAQELPADRFLELRYEDLIGDSGAAIKRLCEFLHEPVADQMLAFDKPANNSWGIEQQPLSRSPVNRHRQLNFVERRVFSRLASPLLTELGYG